MNKKIKVSIIDLEHSSWYRRPNASIDISDKRLECEYRYIMKNENLDLPLQNSRLKNFTLDADYAVIFAYRVPELILIEKNPTVTFIYIQHGYYPDLIKRNISSIFRKFDRIILYTLWLIKFSIIDLNIRKTIDIVKIWTVKGFLASKLSGPKKCFMLDQSWIDFHKDKLGWLHSEYEFLRFYEPKHIISNTTCAIQYVAQTLVEDGRVSKKTLLKVLNEFIAKNQIEKLIILAHPRTDASIYLGLKCMYELEYKYCFNIKTIGHYSSLMLYLAENNIPVMVIGENIIEIPSNFSSQLVLASLGSSKKYTNIIAETYINAHIK